MKWYKLHSWACLLVLQLQRYSLSRLSKSVGRSAVELSLAQFGVLKVMMMELLKTKIEQVAVHRDIASLLRAVQELPDVIARKGEGAAAMWGPDGGDLFEQMSRPICTRVTDMMRPIQEDLEALRDIVSRDGGGAHEMLDADIRTIPATMARTTARIARDAEEPKSTLQGWTQSLQHIADWVHIGGQPQQPQQHQQHHHQHQHQHQPRYPPSQKDCLVLEGSHRRAKIASTIADPVNDLVIINDDLSDGSVGSVVSMEGVRAQPTTKPITPTSTITLSAVSTSDSTSLKNKMEEFSGSHWSSSPVQRAAVQSIARDGAVGLEPSKYHRALSALAISASTKDVSQLNHPAIQQSAQGFGQHPLPGRGDTASRGDTHGSVARQTGRPMMVTEDREWPRPRFPGTWKEADGARLPARNPADRPSGSVDSLRHSSQPAHSGRAAMPPEKVRRSAREGGGRGGKGLSSGYGH